MLRRSIRYAIITLVALFLLTGAILDAGAQTRKKRSRRSRRPAAAKPIITNPTIAPPSAAEASSSGDVKIISTADETTVEPDQNSDSATPKKSTKTTRTSADPEEMQQTITTLSNQVNRLNDRLGQMQENDRYMLDMERLTRAEQRAEQLRSQLFDVQTKLADLQSRLEFIEYSLKPENIDKATQGYGTVHPEDARETRRRQLEREKTNVQAQISLLETSKTRLETSIATADSEVDMLRAKLNQQRDQDTLNPKPETRSPNTRRPE